jgi:hypothetical protein
LQFHDALPPAYSEAGRTDWLLANLPEQVSIGKKLPAIFAGLVVLIDQTITSMVISCLWRSCLPKQRAGGHEHGRFRENAGFSGKSAGPFDESPILAQRGVAVCEPTVISRFMPGCEMLPKRQP